MPPAAPSTYAIVTLGCPKNQVDSDKLEGTLIADGLVAADSADDADVVVVNTCAFIEEARTESIETILSLSEQRRDGAKLVVTGCMAERHGAELAAELPEIDQIAPFGVALAAGAPSSAVSVSLGPTRRAPDFDLLNLPRPASARPWAYVKIAEGCDRACGFCAIPSFRGPQRSRSIDQILAEVDQLAAQEIVLVAQDLAAYGRDQGVGERSIVALVNQVAKRVERVRLLYLYPSDLNNTLIDTICNTGVPYFDLSLQHVSPPLMRRMRRWGNAEVFLERIAAIREHEPDAAFRSNFIVGYPGETEEDHDALLDFVEQAQLDWCGFFAYSEEDGTYAVGLDSKVDPELRSDRLRELQEMQDTITATRRDLLVGREVKVLVDEVGIGRTHREAPEIDGVISVPHDLPVGTFQTVTVAAAIGPDLEAVS
ncbi:MAG: 30S ribosomal protein S12 methylthiotransferase RimO [Acidimicrobiaceae bacterium]|jgi:ribosomal protein S12 methylthiotransferase|nr:30S ribosomal protein S12 methylthiotransferase RimO [Acidimicrobiaceae bacterium]MBT5578688.1 30S ribosomal protein S12 methylthiotransferase RimO [Acidimicrobiaceae bacterium]MBT5849998.1 30S ribosomal protein S12 methylthiotransferase RimO [Acidimicrobiaceae bacterium]